VDVDVVSSSEWDQVVRRIICIRRELPSFVLLQPHAYWIRTVQPIVDGIILNSPAHEAGLQTGDRIVTIGDSEILSKEAARHLLQDAARGNRSPIRIGIERNGDRKSLDLYERPQPSYPYRPPGYPVDPTLLYGIGLSETFRLNYIPLISRMIVNAGARHVLIITSELMIPQLEEAVSLAPREVLWPESVTVQWVAGKNYFWGGNIVLGDLMTVDDHIRVIEAARLDPDLVLIPSSAFRRGRDYLGVPYTSIQRRTGKRVALIPTTRIQI